LSSLTYGNVICLNFFTHEFLHTLEKYPYPAIDILAIKLSEGLREIISWQWTARFLGKVFNKKSSYFFDILANNSPIYKNETTILKPIFDRFKNRGIFSKTEEILNQNKHDDIFDDFTALIIRLSDREISNEITNNLIEQLKKET